MEQVSKTRFDEIYDIMEKSFPPDEMRPHSEQLELFDNSHYRVYANVSEGKYVSFIAIWEFDDLIFIEHFATAPSHRCCGLGNKTLNEIKERFKGKKICLEVEEPEGELQRRRIAFYEREGFHLNSYPYIQPPISEGRRAVPLLIMTFPSPASLREFELIKNTLYREVYRI